jgi:soluble lytic murein transglycosylase-like protein
MLRNIFAAAALCLAVIPSARAESDQSVHSILLQYGPRSIIPADYGVPLMPMAKGRVVQILREEARAQGVPVPLVLAIAHQESGFNPNARSYQNAFGAMQVILPTARALGYQGPVRGLYDPRVSARLGVTYLKQGLQMFGNDIVRVARRYHGGDNLRQHGPKTARYGNSIVNLYRRYASAE